MEDGSAEDHGWAYAEGVHKPTTKSTARCQ